MRRRLQMAGTRYVTASCDVCRRRTVHRVMAETEDGLWLECMDCGDSGVWSTSSMDLDPEEVTEECSSSQ